MKVWIDITSFPHVHFFRAMIKRLEKSGNDVLVTSRDFGIMNDILKRNGIKYKNVGSHGGKDLKSKLIHSSERIIELANIVSKEKPDIGLSKHSIESARVCFGLGVPTVMVIDHETASKQSRLTAPLVNVVVSPEATDPDKLMQYGTKELKKFYGVCEVAHFHDFRPDDGVLKDIGASQDDKILIARSEPLLASHNFHESMLFSVLKSLKKDFPDLKIVFIPRGENDRVKSKDIDLIVPGHSIDTLSLYHYASLIIGAGSCMNREAAIGGCPTVSICPDRLPGVDKLLIEKGMIFHSTNKNEVYKKASDVLSSDDHKEINEKVVKGFEDPYEKIMEAIKDLKA